MFRRLTELTLGLKWPLLLALIFSTVMMGKAILRLQIDPSIDSLFDVKSQDYKTYKEFSEKFGSDHMIAVAMSSPDLFSIKSLGLIKTLTETISGFPQVERVVSLSNANDIKHKFLGIKIAPALGDVFENPESLPDIKKEILDNELYVSNLVSKNGTVANILIYLKPAKKGSASSGLFIKQLREVLEKNQEGETRFYVAGSPVEQYDFVQAIRRDQAIFIPIIAAFLIMTTWVIYRSFVCMVLSMAIVFMTVVWSFGTIVLMGQELNLVTSLLAPVIMIIAVVNSIHLMTLYFGMRVHHTSVQEAILLTMSQLGIPCFLSHFTIILGFVALLFDPVPAIQSFGLFAAIGTLYSYIVSMLLTPILLPLLPYRLANDTVKTRNVFRGAVVKFLEDLDFHWKWWIIAGCIGALVFCYFGIKRLEVDTNLIKQMKPDTPLAISTKFIDENLTGVYVLGFVLTTKNSGDLVDYQALHQIDKFKDFLEAKPEITKVNAITTLVKKINEARDGEDSSYKIPNDDKRLRQYFKGMLKSKDPELGKILTPDLKQTRLEARMKAVGTKQGSLVEDSIKEYMDKELAPYFDYHITGNVVLLGKMSKELVINQIKGFCFAFIAIMISICLIFKSLKMALLAAIPNILPILSIYAIMGFCKIEISSPTAMISSVVLGMVVDASIHFLYRFRLEFSHRHNYLQALHHTYRRVGQSLFVSTLVLVIGFASSIFASFRPTIYFGVLTSLAIFFSLVSTLLFLPVCLITLKPFGREKLFAPPSHVDTHIHV